MRKGYLMHWIQNTKDFSSLIIKRRILSMFLIVVHCGDIFSYEPLRIDTQTFSRRTRAEPIEIQTFEISTCLGDNIIIQFCVLLSNCLSFHSSRSPLLGLFLEYIMGRLRKQTGIEIVSSWSRLGLPDKSYYNNHTRKDWDTLFEGVWVARGLWRSVMQHGRAW